MGRDRSTISFRITFSTTSLSGYTSSAAIREPPRTEDRRHRGDDERHDRDTEVLHHDHRRLERVGQLVDRPGHVLLGRRNGAVAGDDDAHHDHQEREHPGRAPGAESSTVGHLRATVTQKKGSTSVVPLGENSRHEYRADSPSRCPRQGPRAPRQGRVQRPSDAEGGGAGTPAPCFADQADLSTDPASHPPDRASVKLPDYPGRIGGAGTPKWARTSSIGQSPSRGDRSG